MSKEKRNSETIYSFQCPLCEKGTVDIVRNFYDLPDGDKMLILKFECTNCNFHKNDIIPLTTKMDPGIITLKVTNENDLKSKIYRSPTGKLEIPELELLVEPGPRADFYYTNVEGILHRFESAVSIYRNNLKEGDSELQEIEDILNQLHQALEGKFPFTLKITDIGGGSYIIPQDTSKYKFEKVDTEDPEEK
ncbi:MAG: ZPR1 zinc finger domain-containing protein [Promethearchaeota archaeon]